MKQNISMTAPRNREHVKSMTEEEESIKFNTKPLQAPQPNAVKESYEAQAKISIHPNDNGLDWADPDNYGRYESEREIQQQQSKEDVLQNDKYEKQTSIISVERQMSEHLNEYDGNNMNGSANNVIEEGSDSQNYAE